MTRSNANADQAFAQFLAERRESLGGSDAHHLLALEPFGCERQLFYSKAGFEADFPFEGNHHTRRGELLEAIAADEFSRTTGRRVQRTRFASLADRPYVGLHMDRKQWGAKGESLHGPGLLEIKIPSARTYSQLKNDGPAPSYEMQAQWGLWVTGLRWATLWIWNPDLMEGRAFHRERDAEIIAELPVLADAFWSQVLKARAFLAQAGDEDLYDVPYPLQPDGDKRCTTCAFRRRCKGLGEAPTILLAEEKVEIADRIFVEDTAAANDVVRFAELKRRIKELEDEKTAIEKVYKARLLEMDPQGKRGLSAGEGLGFYVQVATRNCKPQPARKQKTVSLKVIAPQEKVEVT